MRLQRKDLLGIEDLSAEEILLILDTASSFKEVAARPIKKVPTLRGRTVMNLFFESSTRTRASFEIAEKRLSADSVSFGSVSGSSVSKGETLLDTARTLEAMAPDILVMRHASSGAPHFIARMCKSSVVNAGDGMHEHPTQALLDAFTIRERKENRVQIDAPFGSSASSPRPLLPPPRPPSGSPGRPVARSRGA